MKCLLTGCNGFIARNFIKYFTEYEIIGLDIRENDRVVTIVQNVSDEIAGNYDIVVHAASGFSNDVDMFNANFLGTKRCIEVATRSGCPLLYISSAEASEPVRTYGIMKLAGECLVKTYGKGLIVRPYHIYGPGMNLDDGRIQSEIIKAISNKSVLKMRGDGTAIRTFTHVNDLLRAIKIVIQSGEAGEIYDVSNEAEATTIENLCKSLCIQYILGEEKHPIKTNIGDSTKVKNLGWEARIDTINGFIATGRNPQI